MVNVWIVSRVGNVVTLNVVDEAGNPITVDIDSFTGNGWSLNRCANITENVQRGAIDDVVDRKALPVEDPEKTMTAGQLAAIYGGWFVELKVQGQTDEYRLRTTLFRLFPVNANNEEVFDNSGVSFDFTFTEVPR